MLNNNILKISLIIGLIVILFYSLSTSNNIDDKLTKEREDYINSILNLPESPLKKSDCVDFFPFNEKSILIGNFEQLNSDKSFKILMTDGSHETMKLAGNLKFEWEGKNYELLLFDEGDSYFLPFNDLSNSDETYGGGRYLNISKDNFNSSKIEIDFNKAHNFYCAYNYNFICPLVPEENQLDFKILAGEKKPKC